MENMVNELYEFLEEFMIESNWEDEHIPEQARAMFTTICFVGNIDADTAKADRMLNDLYFRSAMEEIIEFDDFENFMYEYIV